jgi:hypothetical protein
MSNHPLDLAPGLTALERDVYTQAFFGAGWGTLMVNTGKSERTVSAAYNRACDKQRNYEAEQKMRPCPTCGHQPRWQCKCRS